jgi:serpin B
VLVLLVPMMLVPMMRQASRFSCAEGADYQAVRLPYGGEAADMLIIPPDEGGSGRVEERLGAALLDEVRGNLPETQVGLTMSRFGFETDLTFIDLPEGLSLRPPFGPLRGASQRRHERRAALHPRALHKATITVDEKGTGAASAILDMPVSGGGGPETTTPARPRSPSLFRSGRRVRYCSSVGSSAG